MYERAKPWLQFAHDDVRVLLGGRTYRLAVIRNRRVFDLVRACDGYCLAHRPHAVSQAAFLRPVGLVDRRSRAGYVVLPAVTGRQHAAKLDGTANFGRRRSAGKQCVSLLFSGRRMSNEDRAFRPNGAASRKMITAPRKQGVDAGQVRAYCAFASRMTSDEWR